MDRLLLHHDKEGPRRVRRVPGIPVSKPVCEGLLEELEKWVERDIVRRQKPSEVRERTNIRASHYMILTSPKAFSTGENGGNGSGKSVSAKARVAAAKLAKYADMWEMARRALVEVDPAFAAVYTAVAFTKNFVGSPHIDTQNTGPFYGLALGDFVAPVRTRV